MSGRALRLTLPEVQYGGWSKHLFTDHPFDDLLDDGEFGVLSPVVVVLPLEPGPVSADEVAINLLPIQNPLLPCKRDELVQDGAIALDARRPAATLDGRTADVFEIAPS